MRLVIGSSNFGDYYGIDNSNRKKGFSKLDLKKIKLISEKYNLNFIDTSFNYKNSHKKISLLKYKKKLITKISFKNLKKDNIEDILKNKLNELKKKYKFNIHAILIHDLFELTIKETILALKTLKNIKNLGLISKFGASIYEPKEILKFNNKIKIDYLQIPMNVFDNRFLKSKLVKRLKNKGTKIFVRSCFLQGVLSFNKEPPKSIAGIEKNLEKWKKWCDYKKIDYTQACLHYIKNLRYVDYLIVGFDTPEQLQDLINKYKKPSKIINFKVRKINQKYIDPRKW